MRGVQYAIAKFPLHEDTDERGKQRVYLESIQRLAVASYQVPHPLQQVQRAALDRRQRPGLPNTPVTYGGTELPAPQGTGRHNLTEAAGAYRQKAD